MSFTVLLPIPTTAHAPKKALNDYLLNENRLNLSSAVDLYSSVCEGGGGEESESQKQLSIY